MVDINLDLALQGQLDLRIAGSIGLFNGGGNKKSHIQHSKRRQIEHSPRSLLGRDQEVGQHIRWDETESDDGPSSANSRVQPKRALGRAATTTRQAMSAVKEAMKTEDDQRVRKATELLRQATICLREAVQRASAATTASEQEPAAVDAEFEETH
jgi:hypothetical protein